METCRVRILGSDYSIRTDSDRAHIERVARVVDERMRRIEEQFGPGSSTRTAVLACLTIVDEQLQKESPVDDTVLRRVGALIEKLASVSEAPCGDRDW